MRLCLAALAVTPLVFAGPAALAQPSGVEVKDGVLNNPVGKALYTFANDPAGQSACNGPCANVWPPFRPGEGEQGAGDWSVVTREDGTKQWAYKGKPLYTFNRDIVGRPPMGESVQNWLLAKE